MNRGKVKWFNVQRGYGFIEPDDGSTEVFVHISAVTRSGIHELYEGQAVSYDLLEDRRSGKLAAAHLKLSTASRSAAPV
jgi:cold shock protein